MYLIESTEHFRSLVERVGLWNEDFTLIDGLLAVPFKKRPELLRLEIMEVVKAYNTEENKGAFIANRAKRQGKILRLRPELGLIYLEGDLRANGRVRVVIPLSPPLKAPREEGAVAGSAPSEGLQNLGEVVIRKPGSEGQPVILRNGHILQLDEDEKLGAAGGGIALIVLEYDMVQENQGQ